MLVKSMSVVRTPARETPADQSPTTETLLALPAGATAVPTPTTQACTPIWPSTVISLTSRSKWNVPKLPILSLRKYDNKNHKIDL